MKRFMYLIAAAILILPFTSCKDKQQEEVAEQQQTTELKGISLSKKSLILVEGETAKLGVRFDPAEAADNAPTIIWESTLQRVASVKDGLVTANRAGTATIIAVCGKFEAKCDVEVSADPLPQPEPDPEINFSLEPILINCPANGGTYQITVTSNVAWTAEIENPEWASLSATSGEGDAELTLTVAGTEDPDVASQDITFKAGKGKYYVRVTRAKKIIPMSIDKTEASVNVSGGSFTVNVSSQTNWSVTCDDPRVSFSKSDNSVTVNVLQSTSEEWNDAKYEDRNELQYWESIPIAFSDEDSQAVLTLYQERPYLYLINRTGSLSSACPFEAMSDEKTFNVDLYSNISWEIKLTNNYNDESPSWATVSKTSGTGDASFTLHFDKKTSYSSRKGWLEVYPTGGYKCRTRYYELYQW